MCHYLPFSEKVICTEHKEMSEGHIDSSMEDLLKLCEYERSVQDEVSKLPNSVLKTDYIKLINTDVIFFLAKLYPISKYIFGEN